jgi:hypothetical protein
MMEPLPKIFNRGSVFLSFLASLLALIKLDSKIISTFVGFGESLWRKEMLQESQNTTQFSQGKLKISYLQEARFTFHILDSITIPNKLSTEIYEMFHQRL